jgi:FAD/FMN-containing dehydrogenase
MSPANVKEVSTILSSANSENIPIIPYGGGTGLVGGQIQDRGPAGILLSLKRMNKIRYLNSEENVITVEAGVILSDLRSAAEKEERVFPLSLASEGTAQIGGNLATNAGGLNVLRYGSTRSLCLGLEVVFADGSIWNGLSRLHKDNTGYDLKNLVIGSEGTLGIITAATMKLFSKPKDKSVALIAVGSPKDALRLLSEAKDYFGETISAFELINKMGIQFLKETGLNFKFPLSAIPEWMVLLEIGHPVRFGTEKNINDFFENILSSSLALDGALAENMRQQNDLWAIRENIPEANRRIGSVSSHDISLPLSEVSDFVEQARLEISKLGQFRINCFGHLGDGNLHFNIFPEKGNNREIYNDIRPTVKTVIHDLVHKYGGSVSAEHGIGRLKTNDLIKYSDPIKLKLNKSIKKAMDPNGILNPGVIFETNY